MRMLGIRDFDLFLELGHLTDSFNASTCVGRP
jgi:hypothetical protein